MSSISVDNSTKKEFDKLKPEDMTHDEFTQELLDAYRRDNGEIVNVDEIVEQIKSRVASDIEISAYRGTKEALENNDLD